MNLVDRFLDHITMYRLLIYYLLVLVLAAAGLSATGYLQYNPLAIIFSASYLTLVAWITHRIFTWVFEAPANTESSIITALILSLIINPYTNPHDILFLTAAVGLAIASKFILTIHNKHIFNPAAVAVTLTAIGPGQTASWWVGNQYLMPLVLLGGLLLIRKIERGAMVTSFFAGALVSVTSLDIINHHAVWTGIKTAVLHSSLLFLAFVMLTEPATSPTTRTKRIWYGALAGLMFSPHFHIGGIYSTPERDLVISNVFSYLVSPKQKISLLLKRKVRASKSVVDFIFRPPKRFAYQPGQYMEWTLPHAGADSRGTRRYFTLASSPTEDTLRLGVKFYLNGSSFKHSMLDMGRQTPIAAGQLGGDFIMPKNTAQKLAFVAGGIGVTPFRSMIKYMLDTNEHRDYVLLYSENDPKGFAYTDIFGQAADKIGVKNVFTLTGNSPDWQGRRGQIDARLIKAEVPDYLQRTFYVSGPQPMVGAVKDALQSIGVPGRQIKTDFFPGYA